MNHSTFPSNAGSSGPLPPRSYSNSENRLLESRTIEQRQVSAFISTSLVDDPWDDFLQQIPLGQFQQSCLWAAVKAAEGWRAVRVIVRRDSEIIGGFQLLVRRRFFLNEGFLNKGPVYQYAEPNLLAWMLDLVDRVLRDYRISLLVAQPADADTAMDSLLLKRGYAANGLAPLITATFCLPLGRELPPFETRMRRSLRLEARQATKRGATVRKGEAKDIPVFFDLMCATCRRQNSSPNPATVEALMLLWSTFASKGLARLTLADCEGKPTAGLLTLRFGKTVTQWKKGWNEEFREKHPNTLLAFEGIQWADQQGAQCVDFVGGDRGYAKSIMKGQEPSDKLRASRYFFLVGLGAEPRLLPLARVYVPSLLGRSLYKAVLPVLRRRGRVEVD